MNITLTVIEVPQKGKKFEFYEPDNFLMGRGNVGSNAHFRLNNDDKNEYESQGVTIKKKLGYAALQRAKERLKLVDQDVIRVGQTVIMM